MVWRFVATVVCLTAAGPGHADGTGAPGAAPWTVACEGEGPLRRCTVSTLGGFQDLGGERSRVSLSLLVDRACTTLHAVFEAPIATERRVDLAVDGRPVQRFYTSDQLQDLARAIDGGPRPAAAPPEFERFLAEAAGAEAAGAEAAGAEAAGAEAAGAEPGDEMIARFAAIKEPQRIGMACPPVGRLLPAIRAGRTLALSFHAPPRTPETAWHWPRLDERRVIIDLDGLAAALDRAAASL